MNIISSVLNSIDNAAKETLEEPKTLSATQIRSQRRSQQRSDDDGDTEKTGDDDLEQKLLENPDDPPLSTLRNSLSTGSLTGALASGVAAATAATSISALPGRKSSFSNNDSGRPPISGATNSVSTAAPQSSSGKGIGFGGENNVDLGAGDSELKKLVVKKNKEIEKLNAECLELEDQVSSLKGEVQDAWASYKTAQERAAAREVELLDEIKQLQRAKQSDKQALLAQMGKVGDEVDEALRQMRAMQAERDALAAQVRTLQDDAQQYLQRESALESQLAEARAGSIQGVQGLRDEMRAITAAAEQMRFEHASLLRQSRVRQAELEQANVELTIGITERQRELTRLQLSLEQAGRDEASMREIDGLRQQMASLSNLLEDERTRIVQTERRLRQVETEGKAAQLGWEDERLRLTSTIQTMETQVATLEDKLREAMTALSVGGGVRGRLAQSSPLHKRLQFGNTSTPMKGDNNESILDRLEEAEAEQEQEIITSLQTQVQGLSKQLLQKQGMVLELQAERAALKSRVQDLQARCSKAEQRLHHLRDVEEDGDDGFDVSDNYDDSRSGDAESGNGGSGGGDYSYDFSSGSKTGLQQRKRRSEPMQGRKVITEIEKMGVKPTESVARAVNMIDSWTFTTAKFLRHYPLVRLGFVIYLLVLHLWVLFVLAVHTHSLELDTSPQDSMVGPGNKLSAASMSKKINNNLSKTS